MAYLYFSRKICCKLRNFLKEQFFEIRLVNLVSKYTSGKKKLLENQI